MSPTIRIEFPIKNSTGFTEAQAIQNMVAGLNKLIEVKAIKGDLDSIVENYEIANPGGWAVAIIKKDALVDGSKLETVGANLSFPMDIVEDIVTMPSTRQFSAATIQERLRLQGLDPKIKFRLTILDYKKFYNGNKNKLIKDPSLANRLKNLFVSDLMGIFSQILPHIEEGKQLKTLTGLSTVTQGLDREASELSKAYRRALQQARNGQISSSALKPLQQQYSKFMNLLIPQVFPGIDKILTEETRTHSEKVKGTITVHTSCPDKLYKVLGILSDILNSGKDVEVQLSSIDIEDRKTVEAKYNFDGNGQDRIQHVLLSAVMNKEYTVLDDGSIDLFNENDTEG